MSETLKRVNLDAALREWPTSEKSATDWEQMAQNVDERVRSEDAGASVAYVSNENLLAEPLGQIEGEGHNSAATVRTGQTRVSKGETMTMPVDRERDRRSLQDLAKMAGESGAMTPPPPSMKAPLSSASAPSGVQRAVEAKKDDSGIVDLAMAAQSDPQAAVRSQSTPLASDGLFDDEPASIRPGPVSTPGSIRPGPVSASPVSQQLRQPAPSMPPFGGGPSSSPASLAPISQAPISSAIPSSAALPPVASSPSLAVAAAPAQAPGKKKGGVVLALVVGVVAVGAIAAGGMLFVKHRADTAAARLAANPPVVAPVVAPAEAKPADEAKPAEAANTAPAELDPNALPTATADGKLAVAPKGIAKGALPPVAKAEKPAAPAKPEETAKLSQKDLPTAPTGPAGDLTNAMGKAVGADGKPIEATPAAGNTGGPQFAAGTVPQKPSQGAVTGAIGAVLPGARACLGPDDPVSRATITFTSAGTVSNVNVGGGAAGKPAEACIKSALGKAKVAPFAESSYTANITVRH